MSATDWGQHSQSGKTKQPTSPPRPPPPPKNNAHRKVLQYPQIPSATYWWTTAADRFGKKQQTTNSGGNQFSLSCDLAERPKWCFMSYTSSFMRWMIEQRLSLGCKLRQLKNKNRRPSSVEKDKGTGIPGGDVMLASVKNGDHPF